jgi:hypothetical protein
VRLLLGLARVGEVGHDGFVWMVSVMQALFAQ